MKTETETGGGWPQQRPTATGCWKSQGTIFCSASILEGTPPCGCLDLGPVKLMMNICPPGLGDNKFCCFKSPGL